MIKVVRWYTENHPRDVRFIGLYDLPLQKIDYQLILFNGNAVEFVDGRVWNERLKWYK